MSSLDVSVYQWLITLNCTSFFAALQHIETSLWVKTLSTYKIVIHPDNSEFSLEITEFIHIPIYVCDKGIWNRTVSHTLPFQRTFTENLIFVPLQTARFQSPMYVLIDLKKVCAIFYYLPLQKISVSCLFRLVASSFLPHIRQLQHILCQGYKKINEPSQERKVLWSIYAYDQYVGLRPLDKCKFYNEFKLLLTYDTMNHSRGSWSLCLSCICLLAMHTLICVTFSLPPGVGGWMRLLLVTLPGLFCLFFNMFNANNTLPELYFRLWMLCLQCVYAPSSFVSSQCFLIDLLVNVLFGLRLIDNQHYLGHVKHGQSTYSHCSWASLDLQNGQIILNA